MKKFVITDNWVPLILLGVCLLGFGILIPQLGYYWDDWMHLYLSYTYKDPAALVYQAYRPVHAWLDVMLLSIIGTKPIYWHILSLVFRWLTAWGVWEVLRRIWPNRGEQVAWIAILFSVYPTFFQQSVAFVFHLHWVSFILFLVSIICMIRGYREPNWYWPLTILGILTTTVNLFNLEYLVGLELVRPLIIWLIIPRVVEGWRIRLKQVCKHWGPYLIVLILFVLWRIFFVQIENDPNPVISLSEILKNPFILINLFVVMLRDMLHIFLTSWYKTLQPELISIDYPSDLLALGLVFLTFIILFFVVREVKFRNNDLENEWGRHALIFGLVATFIALLPIWLTGRKVIVGMWSDRLSVPAMFGASIFLVAAIGKIIPRRKTQHILFCVLVSLAVATQFQVENNYRWDWVRQKRTYWQIYWRAPAIEPNTPIISDGALTSFVSRYTAAFALNMLYPQDESSDLPNYWYFEIQYNKLANRLPELIKNGTLQDEFYSVNFSGKSRDSLLILTPSGEDRCLWFLTPDDVRSEEIPLIMRQLTEIVNLDRILPDPVEDDYPIENIFGPEPEHTWCYYYQKASLAHQLGDWDQVIDLWEEAERSGYKLENVQEMIPFIKASANLGRWDQTIVLTQMADKVTKKTDDILCNIWEKFHSDNQGSEDFDSAYEEALINLNCP